MKAIFHHSVNLCSNITKNPLNQKNRGKTENNKIEDSRDDMSSLKRKEINYKYIQRIKLFMKYFSSLGEHLR